MSCMFLHVHVHLIFLMIIVIKMQIIVLFCFCFGHNFRFWHHASSFGHIFRFGHHTSGFRRNFCFWPFWIVISSFSIQLFLNKQIIIPNPNSGSRSTVCFGSPGPVMGPLPISSQVLICIPVPCQMTDTYNDDSVGP